MDDDKFIRWESEFPETPVTPAMLDQGMDDRIDKLLGTLDRAIEYVNENPHGRAEVVNTDALEAQAEDALRDITNQMLPPIDEGA